MTPPEIYSITFSALAGFLIGAESMTMFAKLVQSQHEQAVLSLLKLIAFILILWLYVEATPCQ